MSKWDFVQVFVPEGMNMGVVKKKGNELVLVVKRIQDPWPIAANVAQLHTKIEGYDSFVEFEAVRPVVKNVDCPVMTD